MRFNIFGATDNSFMSYWHISSKKTYVCSPDVPGLMEYDWENEKFMPVAQFPENCRKRDSYALCAGYKNKMICFPSYKSNIVLFCDLNTLEFTQMPVALDINQAGAKIFGVYWHEGHIYAVLYGTKKIIEIDPEEERIVFTYEMNDSKQNIVFVFSTVLDGAIYLTVNADSRIVKFDMNSKSFDVLSIPSCKRSFRAIAASGNCLVMGGYRKELYFMTPSSREFQMIVLPNDIRDSGKDDFYGYDFFCTDFVILEDQIGFLSLHEPGIFFYNLLSKKIDLMPLPEKNNRRNLKSYTKLYMKENRIIGLYSLVDERMVEIDATGRTYRVICPEIDDEIFDWMKQFALTDVGVGKDVFSKALFSRAYDNRIMNQTATVGKRIWQHVIRS